MKTIYLLIALTTVLAGCTPKDEGGETLSNSIVFVGARLIDGTGTEPIDNSVLLISEGRIIKVGTAEAIDIPEGSEVIDVKGKFIMPGLINAHGHIGVTVGLQGGQYSRENVVRDLELSARYGVTTVVSLGEDEMPSIELRNAQNTPGLKMSRLFVAGEIVSGSSPEEVQAIIDYNDSTEVDFIKIRVDDNLGNSRKMPEDIYKVVIDYSHSLGLRVASHIFYLEDARSLLKAGTDFIAHSVRDQSVDDDFIDLMNQTGAYYCPTLMRDVSTFVYEVEPGFFKDPFFLREADPDILEELRNPERQEAIRNRASAQAYKRALDTAMVNLKKLVDGGVTIVMGTDSGPPARFQGYFEHKEMELMADAGMTPMQIIVSATGGSAKAMQLKDIGTLELGKWADFIVLDKNPLEDIRNTKSIASVWIAGNKVARE